MSDDEGQQEEQPLGKRGEAAWKEDRERIAKRNEQARKAGRERRSAYERSREEGRMEAERRRMAELLKRSRPD